MIFLFTTSNKIGARLIRWGDDWDASHFALVPSDRNSPYSVVLESTLADGFAPTWLKSLRKKAEIKHVLLWDLSPEENARLYHKIIDHMADRDYDKKGVLWLSVTTLLRKAFRMKLPARNQWGDRNDVFCSEILQAISADLEKIGVPMWRFDPQMLTPKRAYDILLESDQIKEIKNVEPAAKTREPDTASPPVR